MVDQENVKSSSTPSWLMCSAKCFSRSTSSSSSNDKSEEGKTDFNGESKTSQRKPGGWRSMPYILGNETFERLATIGLLANIMVYLLTKYHLDQVSATNIMNIWSGTTNFSPLIGAFISDAYTGRFKILAVASIASFVGMICLTLTSAVPGLLPPACTKVQLGLGKCIGPTKSQLGVLFTGLIFLTIGAAGIRPCSVPFGVDQFDFTTEEGRKGIASFFNFYYVSLTVVIMLSMTVVVYIQSSVSWVLGLGLPTGMMLCAIVLFWVGTKVYVYVKPGGSVFSGIFQVFAAAFKKRKLDIDSIKMADRSFYDPPMKGSIVSKLPLTQQFRWLNKATMVLDGEVAPDGSRVNNWTLVSVQQVEEVKCIIRVIPIWASGVICFTSMNQQGTFTVSQALKMDRHLGKFEIPAGSLGVISMLTLGIWVPIYDRLLVPRLRKITKQPDGLTLLQRMGIGIIFAILSMVAAGLFEQKRRASAIASGRPDGSAPLSVFWLSPQLILMGLAEAFSIIAQIEFYNKEFPENMRSLANSLLSCTMAGANYLSSLIVVIVQNTTGGHGKPDWLDNNINKGRVDYFYYVIAGLGVVNMVYFLVCSRLYYYKGSAPVEGMTDVENNIELNTVKSISDDVENNKELNKVKSISDDVENNNELNKVKSISD